MRKIIKTILAITVIFTLSGCAFFDSLLNDLKGDLIGNSFKIETYDNYGELTMTTYGQKVNMKGHRVKELSVTDSGYGYNYVMSSVVTITIDGKEMESCGDTLIFAETGLEKVIDFTLPTFIETYATEDITENTSLAYYINQYANLFGKSRIIVIKSQMGQPLCAYAGDNVYWEIPNDLPKTTKLMIDGKALYVHRANYQIIDKALLSKGQ